MYVRNEHFLKSTKYVLYFFGILVIFESLHTLYSFKILKTKFFNQIVFTKYSFNILFLVAGRLDLWRILKSRFWIIISISALGFTTAKFKSTR